MLFSLFRKVDAISLHSKSLDDALYPKERCVNALSLHARSVSGALSLPAKCVDGVLREKREFSRPFLKVDEVEDHPYHLGEVAFSSLTYGEDPLDPSS